MQRTMATGVLLACFAAAMSPTHGHAKGCTTLPDPATGSAHCLFAHDIGPSLAQNDVPKGEYGVGEPSTDPDEFPPIPKRRSPAGEVHPSEQNNASAEDLEQNRRAVGLLDETADRICYVIPLTGSAKTISLRLQNNLPGKLQRLSEDLAKLGVFGSFSYTSVKYTGVLQKDLSQTLVHSIDCKLKVTAALQDKLLRVNRDNVPIQSGVGSEPEHLSEYLILYEGRDAFKAQYTKGYAPYTWHIIVESYFSANAAETRIRELNEKYTGLFFQQIQSNYKPNIWMVTLGSGIGKKDADELLKVASLLPDFEKPYEYCWFARNDPRHQCKR
jgi:hypothetical protein